MDSVQATRHDGSQPSPVDFVCRDVELDCFRPSRARVNGANKKTNIHILLQYMFSVIYIYIYFTRCDCAVCTAFRIGVHGVQDAVPGVLRLMVCLGVCLGLCLGARLGACLGACLGV